MKKHRLTIAVIGLSVAALVGGFAIAFTGGSGSAQSAGAVPARGSATSAAPGNSTTTTGSMTAPMATVKTAMARVGGVVEVVLVNDKGLPLYTYKPDTATQSMVTGELAALWPPLVANVPTGSGEMGGLAVVHTGNGQQVTYNGHFLYTFAEDSPGQVTGQGVQNFSVATPALAPIRSTVASGTTKAISPAPMSPSYGY